MAFHQAPDLETHSTQEQITSPRYMRSKMAPHLGVTNSAPKELGGWDQRKPATIALSPQVEFTPPQ